MSYSFYLTHGLGIELVMYRYHDAFLGFPAALYIVLTLGASLALSVVFATVLFLVAERPYFHRNEKSPKALVAAPEQAVG
jgi:peptidoglycan/LPS O-acetylase OafA/YrhL